MKSSTHQLLRANIGALLLLPSIGIACWSDAERLYGVSAYLLYAVARAESDLNAGAVNLAHRGRTGTYDIGLMQVNSSHLPKLAALGIAERDLLEPCTNIKVGAWLLADSFARRGVSWDAVGAYNAVCTRLGRADCAAARSRYAWRVYRRLPVATATGPSRQAARLVPVLASVPAATPFILSARVTQ